MNKLKIHIILVNYNGYEDTIECIDSIIVNRYRNYKIIVVDNASTDDSRDMLIQKYNNHNDIHIIFNNENVGFSGGNNIGIKYALQENPDFIMLLNNDTIIDVDAINNIIEVAKDNHSNKIYTGKIKLYKDKSRIWYGGGSYKKWRGTSIHRHEGEVDCKSNNVMCNVDFICGCYLLIDTLSIKKIGYLPEEYFLYSEDLDLSLNALNKGFDLIYVPSSVIYHKVSSSTSKFAEFTQYYMIRNRFYVIKKYNNGFSKVTAYMYSLLWCVKRVIKGEFTFDNVKKALRDVLQGKMGRLQ